jgi:hypothetical protein
MPTRKVAPVADGPLPSVAELDALARAFAIAPALTREQLGHWFVSDSAGTLCRRLRRFADRGLLVRRRLATSRGGAPFAYALSRRGSAAIFGEVVRHGSGQLGRDVRHSLGIADFYLRLDFELRQIDGELLTWWGQAASLAQLGSGRAYVNPDGAFLIGHRREQLFLLEYDRAPNAAGVTRFLEKLVRYRRYYEHRVYVDQFGLGNLRPILLCLFIDRERMERVRARARRLVGPTGVALPLLFGDARAASNPLAPTWYDLAGETRFSIFDDRLL